MHLYPHQENALRALKDEFAAGARAVRMRGRTGIGAGITTARFVAGELGRGRCLILSAAAAVRQPLQDLERVAPGLAAGGWGSGRQVEVASYRVAARGLASVPSDAFSLIVLGETWEAEHDLARAVVGHFPGARVLEVSMAPRPCPGMVEADADLDLLDAAHGEDQVPGGLRP